MARAYTVTKQFKGLSDVAELSSRTEQLATDLVDLISGIAKSGTVDMTAALAAIASLAVAVDSKQDTLVPTWLGYVETAAAPNTTDFPENTFGLHYDNVGLVYRFCFSKGGAVRKVTLT